MHTDRVREILSWYAYDNPGVRTNLARMLNTGALAGTGKFMILPVDQGFEHGPIRSFAPNPPGYDPDYHLELAVAGGFNAYAAPMGQIETAVGRRPGEIPIILKVNNADLLAKGEPYPAVTASVKDALRLGCSAIGFTIYPGSSERNNMYGEIREMAAEAKAHGLVVVIWSYPRGSGIPKECETAVDVACYAAQIAAQLGAHMIKVKPPSEKIMDDKAKAAFEKAGTPLGTLPDRVKAVVQSAFNGKRIVIFSGGEAKGDDAVLEEIRNIHRGGGFGSIIGRNSFQRKKEDALVLLKKIVDIYKS